MKKYFKILLVAFFTLAVAATIIHSNFVTTGAQSGDYIYTVSRSKVTITKYIGTGGNVTIPSTLDGHPVTTIGSHAFYNCDGLTSLTVPDSLETIGDNAFAVCMNLDSFDIPNTVAVDETAFRVQ